MDVAFGLKEGPQPLDFITKENLKAFGQPLGEDPQVTLTVGPFTATTPPATSISIETIVGPTNGFNFV